jgi:hypothetical protein
VVENIRILPVLGMERGCPIRWQVAGGRGTNPLHATSMFCSWDEDRDAVTAPPAPDLG